MVAARQEQAAELLDLDAIRIVKAERRLREFVKQAWPEVEPGRELVPGFYIDAICDHLQAVAEGDITRLVITLPPGFLKSTIVSVLFPAWLWIDHPALRFITTSHDGDLAMRDAVRSRRVITSEWYQERWGDRFAMTTDQNVKTRYENDRTGHRISLGTGGGITGKRADLVLCDDPHDAEDAHSETELASAVRWWNESVPSRLNDPDNGPMIVIQQRLHVNDLAGEVISQGYEHLNLPMEYEPARSQVTGIGWTDPRTEPGDLLDPVRYKPETIDEKKQQLGTAAYNAQYQQSPIPAEGGMFKRHWWQTYEELPPLRTVALFVDSAFKEGVENDFSVFALWGSDGQGGVYLVRVWRRRVAFPALIQLGHDAYAWARARFPGKAIQLVVEDKASGQSAIQVWGQPYHTARGVLPKLPVSRFTVKSKQSKIARAEGVTPIVEGGQASIPEDALWLDDWLTEHEAFPLGDHDDQVDTTSMALTRLALRAAPTVAAAGMAQQSRWSRT